MIECFCINNKNKPKEIPLSHWIQEGFKYHITHVFFHPNQGINGVELREVRLGKESKPYESFKLSRFAMTEEAFEQLKEMIKDCSELNDIDILKMIEESNLEKV